MTQYFKEQLPRRTIAETAAYYRERKTISVSLVLPWVNTETMSMFLTMVAERHENEFVMMVMDQAGWHISAGLEVPPNMRLVFLPPYSPEINPAEHIWDALRENTVGNTVFGSLDAADKALSEALVS